MLIIAALVEVIALVGALVALSFLQSKSIYFLFLMEHINTKVLVFYFGIYAVIFILFLVLSAIMLAIIIYIP